MHRRTLSSVVVLGGVAALAVSGCGLTESTKSAKSDDTVAIAFTDDGCAPKPASADAGALTFKVSNDHASRVSETELLQNGRIIGERENLSPGLSGTFTLKLQPGRYVVNCPNAKADRADFTVTGKTSNEAADVTTTQAVAAYKAFVVNQVDTLVRRTAAFTAAVKVGDLVEARTLYAPTRYYYEQVEPVAESFGTLDPDIDARVNDVASTATWTGFHRVEKALWQDRSLTGMSAMADKLTADVATLQRLTRRATFQPAQIANGAVSLLDEVAKSKITGEEDRYSHADLSDFDANVAGAREAFQVLEPILQKKDPALVTTLNTRFRAVLSALAKYQTRGGYVNYSTVTTPERRQLATVVNALAEPLSDVAGKVV